MVLPSQLTVINGLHYALRVNNNPKPRGAVLKRSKRETVKTPNESFWTNETLALVLPSSEELSEFLIMESPNKRHEHPTRDSRPSKKLHSKVPHADGTNVSWYLHPKNDVYILIGVVALPGASPEDISANLGIFFFNDNDHFSYQS